MAILTRSGRAAIAKALKAAVGSTFLAIGRGDGAWSSTWPAESPTATALIDEIGRRKATSINYVVQDDNGEFEIPGAGKFAITATPTRQLMYTFNFAFEDAAAETIRELGIFINVQTNGALPPGQMFFTPAQVTNPGDLLQLENRAPIVRTASTREIFNLLVTL